MCQLLAAMALPYIVVFSLDSTVGVRQNPRQQIDCVKACIRQGLH
jgi:hypothetical protein